MANEGILNQVSVGLESTIGTAVAPTYSLPIQPSDGVQGNQEVNGSEAINTTPALNKCFYKGLKTYEGDFEMAAYPNSIGYLLLSALGSVSSAAVSGDTSVYDHTFAETVAKKGLTVEQVVGAEVNRFAGFVVSSITISGRVGEEVKVSVSGQALSEASATKITPVYEVTCPFDWAGLSTLTLLGRDIRQFVEEFEIEYTNGLEVFHGMGNIQPVRHYVGNSELTGSITMYMDTTLSNQLKSDYLAVNTGALVLGLTGASIGTSSNLGLTLTGHKVAVTSRETPLDTDYNQLELEFEGAAHPTNGLFTAVLRNLLTAYN